MLNPYTYSKYIFFHIYIMLLNATYNFIDLHMQMYTIYTLYIYICIINTFFHFLFFYNSFFVPVFSSVVSFFTFFTGPVTASFNACFCKKFLTLLNVNFPLL